MIRALVLLVFLSTWPATARADEPAPEQRVFVEVVADKDAWYVGEIITLRLRVGFEAAFFETNAIPLFRQTMDVPLQAHASWLASLEGTTALPSTPVEDEEGLRLALEERVTRLRRLDDVERQGRVFTVLEHARTFEAARPGEIDVSAPSLRFAYGTTFRDDFISGRTALDRRDVVVTGDALTVSVRQLPDQGRPEHFEGAVGRFTVRATVDRTVVSPGDVIRLTLTIEGDGNQASFGRPRLGIEGFHELGAIDETTENGRRITYDIAPTGVEVFAVPPVAFAFFDPDAGRYQVVHTEPIPVTVRKTPRFDRPEEAAPPEPEGAPVWVWALALFFVLLATLYARRRSTPPETDDDDPSRVRDARAELRAQLEAPTEQLGNAFAAFLAAHLHCEPAAVVAPGLTERLEHEGVGHDVAHRAAGAMESLVAARYGGSPGTLDAKLVDELESAFAR